MLREEPLWPQLVVLFNCAQHFSTGHVVPGHHVFIPPVRYELMRARKSRMIAAISGPRLSKAKCPASSKWISACGLSRLNACAPAGRKNGSFFPHTARSGGRDVRK